MLKKTSILTIGYTPIFVILGVVLLKLSSVSADPISDINRCGNSDAVCVGKVLLEKIDQMGGGSNPTTSVEFYHSDSCTSGQLLTIIAFGSSTADNERRCEARSTIIHDAVWGVKYQGRCYNITDDDFLTVCKSYI